MSATMGDVFRRAAEIIRERGQAKGVGETFDGGVCLVIAIARAGELVDGRDYHYRPVQVAWEQFRESQGIDPMLDCVTWNDEIATQAEVEKFFLFAADRADFPDGQS